MEDMSIMKTPLFEGDALIRAMLLEHWHVTVKNIYFIPVGDSAYSYKVETLPNNSYYLKVVDQSSASGRMTAARMENFSLPLQSLIAQAQLANVGAPLPQPTI